MLGPGQSARPEAGLAALCLVRWDARAAALRLEVILGDGRVYERKIAAKAAGRERTAARLVASTIPASRACAVWVLWRARQCLRAMLRAMPASHASKLRPGS